MKSRRPTDWVLIAIFLAAIWLPLLAQGVDIALGKEKIRKIKAATGWEFPAAFAKYYGNNFGLRESWIRWHALMTYKVLGISPSDKVLVGKDEWLYYADDSSLEDYRSAQPFTDAEMKQWQRVMEQRRDWLEKHGAKLLLVFACDKYVIYPEFLPDGYRRPDVTYRIDQLADYLKTNSTLTVVNLHPWLESGKASDRLYHRTDTHWNDRGASIGYREILKGLGLAPRGLDSFEARETVTKGWDLARMIKLDDVISEENRSLEPRTARQARVVEQDRPDDLWNNGRVALEVADPTLPRLVMFRDSFGSALVPFLAEHFQRSVYLWQYDFDPKVILQEKPTAVVWLMTSRRLQWFQPVNPVLP